MKRKIDINSDLINALDCEKRTSLLEVHMTKAKYLDNRDLALRIMGPGGLDRVKSEIGDRLTPVRASRIVKLLREEYEFKNVPKELVDLAAQKKPGHFGGPVKPPQRGETREYTVGANGRIGVPLAILGKKPGDKALVKYGDKQIVIRGDG